MSQKEKIIGKIREILGNAPEGLSYSVLLRQVCEALPEINKHTIVGKILRIEAENSDEFYKPARGIYRHVKFKELDVPAPVEAVSKVKEADFYSAFRDYLTNELDECSKAMVVGGNKFKEKWSTPDVIGVLRPNPTDAFKFFPEIVSAEIKLDSAGLITAFGQACAYKLFSHKSYIVVPSSAHPDIERLDSLSMIIGIGLIVFDAQNPKNPAFKIRTRAARHEPDMFYVNKLLKEVANDLLS